MAPGTFLTYSTEVSSIPMTASSAQMPDVLKSVRKSVIDISVDELTTIPAFCKPINAMNIPSPTETPCFSESGMLLKIASRIFVRDSMMNMMPRYAYETR